MAPYLDARGTLSYMIVSVPDCKRSGPGLLAGVPGSVPPKPERRSAYSWSRSACVIFVATTTR